MTNTIPSAPSEKQEGLDQEPEIPVASQAVVIDEFADGQQQQDPIFTTAIPIGTSEEPSIKYSTPATATSTLERTVEVIAPTNLSGGYQFYVDVANQSSLKVEVPPGGVQQGQRFRARVVEEAFNDPHRVPTGHWRDNLCDCCRFGCCHPQCCLTCWCTACALGQVLTRLKLDWCANPQRTSTAMTTFTLFVIITAVYFVVTNALSVAVQAGEDDAEKDDEGDYVYDDWIDAVKAVRFVVDVSFWVFLLVVTTRARGYIRNKYNIPEKHCCDGCEDFCCSFWCTPCTICQMARHTADYHTYSAGCCTEDGLSRGAPQVV